MESRKIVTVFILYTCIEVAHVVIVDPDAVLYSVITKYRRFPITSSHFAQMHSLLN